MYEDRHSRFRIPESLEETPMLIVGCGAVGSFIGLALTKMGKTNSLIVIDYQSVESINLGPQWFLETQIGMPKAQAVWNNALEIDSDSSMVPLVQKYNKRDILAVSMMGESMVIIVAVDDMDVRKQIFEDVVNNVERALIIDCRMAENIGQIIVTDISDPKQVERYGSTLFPEDEAYVAPCSTRSTVQTPAIVGAMAAAQAVRYCAWIDQLKETFKPYEPPFLDGQQHLEINTITGETRAVSVEEMA